MLKILVSDSLEREERVTLRTGTNEMDALRLDQQLRFFGTGPGPEKKKVSSIRCVIQQLHTTTTRSSNPKEAQFALCPHFMNILQQVCSMK